MLIENPGVDDDDLKELEALFKSDEQQENSPPAEGNTEPDKSVDQTKAFAKRLKESTDKARSEERENIAKSLGYNSYEELQKSNERKAYEEKGLDPDEISPFVDELVQKRINEDPRMKELEAFKAKQVEEFGKRELAELTKLTNGKITKLEDVPKDTIELWKTKGSLKAAYIELHGEELILEARNGQNKGSTSHMHNLSNNSSGDSNKRPLTDKEKSLWKLFHPHMTEKELNEMMVEK